MAIRYDQIQLTGSGGHTQYPQLSNAASQTLNIQTSHGYLRLGSDNGSYAHITTDRPYFYFNKAVSFDGSIAAYGGDETATFASFIDSNNTAYYVNPATSAQLHTPITFLTDDTTLSFIDAGTNAFQIKTGAGDELYLGSNNNYQLQMNTAGNVNTQGDWRFGANFIKVGNSSTYNSDDGSWGSRFVVSSTVHARIDCAQDADAVRASWFTHTGHSYSTFGTVTGHHMRLISHNATRQFLYNGYSEESAQYRAPIFYDSANTAYYLDPASTSTSLSTAGKLFVQGGHGSARVHINYQHSDDGNSGALTSWVSEPGITYNSAGIGGNINVSGQYYGRAYNSGYGSYVRFDKNNGNVEHWVTTGNAGTSGGQGTRVWYNDNSGNSFAASSSRAPIFYDSADTTYYVDPATGSILKGVRINTNNSGAGSALKIYTTTNHQYPQIHSDASLEAMWNYKNSAAEWYVGIRTSSQLLGTTGFHFYNTTSAQTVFGTDINGHSYSIGSSRAPLFYDSNDTGHYLDPASTSVVNTVRFSGSSNNGRFDADEWGVRFKTDAGYLLFGPANTSHAHIYTDRPNVYFNAPITVNGNSIINTGDMRAGIFYDVDNTGYYLNPAGTSKTSINIIDGRLTIGQSGDAGGTYRLYTAAGGQVYFGGHMNAASATFNGAIDNGSYFANLGTVNLTGVGNSPIGTGYGSGKLLGYDQSNGSGRAAATLGVNDQGHIMEYEKIMTFKIEGNGWVNRKSNPYKLIQAPGADKMIVVDEFLVYIDYATRTGLGNSGIGLSYESAAYSVGFYLNETGQSISTANHGVSSTFYTAGIMPGGFMNTSLDRGYYRDVPVHQSALIANRSLFFKTSRNCSSSGNAPGGAHYIKIKYRVVDISEEFNAAGCNQTIDVSGYHGQYAHDADGQKQFSDGGNPVF